MIIEEKIPEGSILIKTLAKEKEIVQVWKTPTGEEFVIPLMEQNLTPQQPKEKEEIRDIVKIDDTLIEENISPRWVMIDKRKVATGGEDFDFNITTPYDQYKLIWYGYGESNNHIVLRFNDDDSTHYYYGVSGFDGGDKNTTVSSLHTGGGSTGMSIGFHYGSWYNVGHATISEFATGTNLKTVYGTGSCGSNTPYISTGYWNNNEKLKKITFYSDFSVGAIVALLGRSLNIIK